MQSPAILIVKTSSLGDVVHNMPAITDLKRARPQAHISWLVEEDYAPLARLHPAVDVVIPVAVRRWRRQLHLPATWREMRAFARDLRQRAYDLVIDTQGLSRSALLAALARGPRHGYDSGSIRERLAVPLYQIRHTVARDLHAIERNRSLVGLAAGYEPSGAPDYGLAARGVAGAEPRYAVLLHASAQAEKEWPEPHWVAVGKALRAGGHEIVLPWGTARERGRSETIATAVGDGTRIPDRTPLDQTARMLAGSALVIGLDTGLIHLAAAMAVPVVAIFTGSKPELTAPRGPGPIVVLGANGAPPDPEAVIASLRRLLPAQSA